MTFTSVGWAIIWGAVCFTILWINAECRNWKCTLRMLLGFVTIIFVSWASVCVSMLQISLREYYYETVLFNMGEELNRGNDELVKKCIAVYINSPRNNNGYRQMGKVYDELQKVSAERWRQRWIHTNKTSEIRQSDDTMQKQGLSHKNAGKVN